MGPSPASSARPPLVPPSSSSSASSPDWFLMASLDRDTQILTQALTRELSTPASPSPSQTLVSGTSREERFNRPESLHVLRALQQQHKQQHQLQRQADASAASFSSRGSGGLGHQDGFHHVEPRPPSSNSHSPLSASNPGSPYSNVSTITTTGRSMSIPMPMPIPGPMDNLLAQIMPNISQHHDVQAGPSFESSMISSNASSPQSEIFNLNSNKCSPSSRTGSIALSSQAAQGAGGNKISKRRSRASNRNPLTILSADVTNFRAMVQELTGIPSTSSMRSYGNPLLLKPHAAKHHYSDMASLPTLDTSASFLGSKPTAKDPLEGFSFTQVNHYPFFGAVSGVGKSGLQGCNEDSMCQSGVPFNAKHSVFGDQPNVSPSSSTLSSVWDYASNAKSKGNYASMLESPHFSTTQGVDALDQDPLVKPHHSAGDSWLSFDGVFADHASNMEIARMA